MTVHPERSSRIFLSHSSVNKEFAKFVAKELRSGELQPWIDSEQILVGDDILDRLGEGLTTMDLLLFIISRPALRSSWVDRELKFAAQEEIVRKQILIAPFVVDDTGIDDLPWFLRHRHVECVTRDNHGAVQIMESVRKLLERRREPIVVSVRGFQPDPRIDALLHGIRPGDWIPAAEAALKVLEATDERRHNGLFQALLKYQDCPDDDDRLLAALHVLESCADLAPWLFDHEMLSRMTHHASFSVRSAVASICMTWAQYAPELVPVDLLIKLSVYDEDWYVERPAVAALQSMAREVPIVLSIFYSRLASSEAEARVHSARALYDIALKEAEILDPERLKAAVAMLGRMGDTEALPPLTKALHHSRRKRRYRHWKYGL